MVIFVAVKGIYEFDYKRGKKQRKREREKITIP
jgi:hypothetical protein